MCYLPKVVFIACCLLTGLLCADDRAESQQILDRVNEKASATQFSVDTLANEIDAKVIEYRKIIQKTESIRQYNQQLQTLIESQIQEIYSLNLQASELEKTRRDIGPLMNSMLDSLALFIELDMPFLTRERAKRIQELKLMMARADVSISEKYRRILESYMIEVDYGNTIEAYDESLELNGKTLNVEMLRVGRIALTYKTRDDQFTGFWNVADQQWQPLGSRYLTFIQRGLKIARKQAAPNLLTIPVRLMGDKL